MAQRPYMQHSFKTYARLLILGGALMLGACDDTSGTAKAASDEAAKLSLKLVNFSYSLVDGRHRFTHDRVFNESNNVGLTITRGRVCVDDGKECADALVTYRVEAGKTLTQPNHHIASKKQTDKMSLHYWYKDDNGHEQELHYTLETHGEVITITN